MRRAERSSAQSPPGPSSQSRSSSIQARSIRAAPGSSPGAGGGLAGAARRAPTHRWPSGSRQVACSPEGRAWLIQAGAVRRAETSSDPALSVTRSGAPVSGGASMARVARKPAAS